MPASGDGGVQKNKFLGPARRPSGLLSRAQATRQNRKLDSPAITILILITSVPVLLRPRTGFEVHRIGNTVCSQFFGVERRYRLELILR